MRFAIDIISIFYLLIITAVKLICYLYYSAEVFWVVPISLLGSIVAMLIKHNHCHLAIFRHQWMNYSMDMWLNLLTGTSCASAKIIHNMNHHTYINDKEHDWGSTVHHEKRGGLSGIISYVLTIPIIFIKSKQKWLKDHKNSFLYTYNTVENIFIIAPYSAICYFNFKGGFFVFIVPLILLQFSLAIVNYLQHRGHGPDDKKSNDVKSKWFNMLFFNIGYHSEHHNHPEKHWSLLNKDY